MQGEQMPYAKLTTEKVVAIREAWATGKRTVLDLAKEFNVSGPTLWKAATGKTWRHV